MRASVHYPIRGKFKISINPRSAMPSRFEYPANLRWSSYCSTRTRKRSFLHSSSAITADRVRTSSFSRLASVSSCSRSISMDLPAASSPCAPSLAVMLGIEGMLIGEAPVPPFPVKPEGTASRADSTIGTRPAIRVIPQRSGFSLLLLGRSAGIHIQPVSALTNRVCPYIDIADETATIIALLPQLRSNVSTVSTIAQTLPQTRFFAMRMPRHPSPSGSARAVH